MASTSQAGETIMQPRGVKHLGPWSTKLKDSTSPYCCDVGYKSATDFFILSERHTSHNLQDK